MTPMPKISSALPPLKFKPCTVTPQQSRAWTETRAALLWEASAFSHILYTMMSDEDGGTAYFTKDVPIAATDGARLIINPDAFFKDYSLKERVFIVAHEIMHCVYAHMQQTATCKKRNKVLFADGSSLPYEHESMNMAMDYVINDLLDESNIGKIPANALRDKSIATQADSAFEAYRKVYKKRDGKSKSDEKTEGFDQHTEPDNSEGNGDGRNETEWKQAVAAAAAAARAQGKLPAALEKAFGEILSPTVTWAEHIEAFFARKVGSGSSDWRRPDRRLIVRDIYAPSRSGHGAGTIVVAVDTSGSIAADPAVIDMFFAELSGILEDVRPQRVIALWCDAKVHRADELEDASDLNAVRAKPIPGWGGTSFVPVFDWVEENNVECDALIYLTDGYGLFPSRPPQYPVLWGALFKEVTYPFGEVVNIPPPAK